jgi:hypothetical protein
MGARWKFLGEFRRGRKASLSLECIVAVPNRRKAEAIASKVLVGADQITATQLSRVEIEAYLIEGGVRL